MSYKVFLLLLLGAAVYGMPHKPVRLDKDDIGVSSMLMPGPVMYLDSKETPMKKSPSLKGYQCDLCELAVKEIDSMLKQNETQEEIKVTLDKICSELPGEAGAECKKFVDQYLEIIMKTLVTMDPKLVCTELGLCKAANKGVKGPINDVSATPQCEMCELLAQKLDDLITENSTQEEIEGVLMQICNYLPSSYKSECDSLVQEYTPLILDALANEISPSMLCSTLGLCSSSLSLESRVSNGSELCDMCLEIIGMAKKLVEDNETEADVEKVLKLICWYMLPIKKECDNFVDKVVPLVFGELKKLDPQDICKQLKMCPSDFMPNDVRCFLIGMNQCENPELAKQCGMEARCKIFGSH